MGFGTMNNYMQYWFVWAAHHSQISSSRANEQIIDLVSAHQKPGLPPTACHGVTSAPSFWTCHDTCNCGAVTSAPRWTQTSGAVRPCASDVRRPWLVLTAGWRCCAAKVWARARVGLRPDRFYQEGVNIANDMAQSRDSVGVCRESQCSITMQIRAPQCSLVCVLASITSCLCICASR